MTHKYPTRIPTSLPRCPLLTAFRTRCAQAEFLDPKRTPLFQQSSRNDPLVWRLGSVRLHASELDHFAPLLGFVGNELREVSGRARKHRGAHVGKPRPDLWVGESCVDFPVELTDDFGGRGFWGAQAFAPTCLGAK